MGSVYIKDVITAKRSTHPFVIHRTEGRCVGQMLRDVQFSIECYKWDTILLQVYDTRGSYTRTFEYIADPCFMRQQFDDMTIEFMYSKNLDKKLMLYCPIVAFTQVTLGEPANVH